jgi:hypothetical protein
MNKWKWALLASVVAVLCVVAALLLTSLRRSRDLGETLSWMDQTYNPHEGGENFGQGHGVETHYLADRNSGTEQITEEYRTNFSHDGCRVAIHNETMPVGIMKDTFGSTTYTFNLRDIDPDSIKIRVYDFHKDIGGCDDPNEVNLFQLNCSNAEVEFSTRDGATSVEEDSHTTFAKLEGAEHESESASKTTWAWFDVDDAGYARRFAKALRHAVELCGGKTSKF